MYSRRWLYIDLPWATVGLLVVNGLVFLWQLWLWWSQGPAGWREFIEAWGLAPQHVGNGGLAFLALTATGVHDGILTLAFNGLLLWVFGPAVEDLTGSVRFILLCIVGALLGGMLTLVIEPASTAPFVGAGGVVATVMGAHLRLIPGRRWQALVLALALPIVPRLVIWSLKSAWFIPRTVWAQAALLDAGFSYTNLGIWIHLGGFLAGLILVSFFLRQAVVFHRRPSAPIPGRSPQT